jgi:hypothetical protein
VHVKVESEDFFDFVNRIPYYGPDCELDILSGNS